MHSPCRQTRFGSPSRSTMTANTGRLPSDQKATYRPSALIERS
jgi:hypothetical protein